MTPCPTPVLSQGGTQTPAYARLLCSPPLSSEAAAEVTGLGGCQEGTQQGRHHTGLPCRSKGLGLAHIAGLALSQGATGNQARLSLCHSFTRSKAALDKALGRAHGHSQLQHHSISRADADTQPSPEILFFLLRLKRPISAASKARRHREQQARNTRKPPHPEAKSSAQRARFKAPLCQETHRDGEQEQEEAPSQKGSATWPLPTAAPHSPPALQAPGAGMLDP